MKFGTLSAILVLATTIISTIDLSQNFVFAQNSTSLTRTPELAGSNGDESSSNENNDSNNESTDSSSEDDTGSQDATSSDSQDATSSEGDTGSQDAISSEDEEDETEDDSEQTNPLLEEIRKSVSGALSATGMPGPGF
jgi:cytoskeletal protein RodZ